MEKGFRPKKRPAAVEAADHALQRAVVRGEPPEVIAQLRQELQAAEAACVQIGR